MAIKLHDSFAIHPGPWLLEEIVKPYNMNVSSTADHLKVTRPALSRLLNGRAALTPEMAIRFEKAFGISAATMLRMQSAYDLAQAKSGSETISIERVREPA
ncbi:MULTISPECIES: HigA family addiction module antitoxin [Erythrobacter]|jgi:addiction module HigA family antidote|uniref:HigA family addiction module antitoxin n=1 Tax=Sphingomonadales TaxID=204457 RepID=UPI00082D3BA8|nr:MULTISPECIES: HigA family addiction module antitoxin [Erythrobacter]MDZ4140255.1 HigA family addiction module antitoxin [Erythrobacter sp.]MDZ4273393.1 HigA family addiction module antitoxin [Erythrobacter sp.]